MSSVLRPSGPLPPRVYWMRRGALLVAVIVVASVLWWVLSGLGGASQQNANSGPASQQNANSGPQPAQASGDGGQATPGGAAVTQPPHPTTKTSHHGQRPGHQRHAASGRKHRKRPPLAQSTGACAPTDVGIQIEVADSTAGETADVTLVLTSLRAAACTLSIRPDTLVLRITSGSDVVWSSDDCPNSLPARQVVVRADPASTYRFQWDGRRSVQGCTTPRPVAKPGGYWVEAALVGADIHKAYFDIVA